MADDSDTRKRFIRELAALREEINSVREHAAEEALRAVAGRVEALLHAIPEAVYVLDTDGHYLDMLASEDHELYSASDAKTDRRLSEVLPEPVADKVLDAVRKAVNTQSVHQVEFMLNTAEGPRWLEGRTAPLPHDQHERETAVLVVRDVTGQRRAETLLREGEQFLEDVFASIQDGVAVLDADLTIARVNPVLERWCASNMPLVGKKCYEAFHNRAKVCGDCPALRALNTGITERAVMRGLPGSQSEWLEIFCFPMKNESTGQVTGVVEFARDTTELVHAERQKEDLQRQLHQSEKMRAVGQLAGGVAHDFNNQITGIMACVDMLKMQLADNAEANTYIDLIATSAQRAAELTSQLLAFSRRERYVFAPLDVHMTVSEVTGLLKRTADKRIKIVEQLDARASVVKADHSALQNALLNIAINASDAMEQGGEIRFATGEEMLNEEECRRDSFEPAPGSYVSVKVIDQGRGMDEGTMEHIFEPFFTTKEKGKGTGMGLAAVYGTVKSHHGTIRVDSRVGKGTTFEVLLPLIAEAAPEPQPAEGDNLVEGAGRILLIDDEEIVRESARGILSHLGYTVTACESGVEALEHYRSAWQDFDLVVLDMVMPELDGPGTFTQLRSINPEARIIITSGLRNASETQSLLERGAVGLVAKPFKFTEFSRAIADALQGASGAS